MNSSQSGQTPNQNGSGNPNVTVPPVLSNPSQPYLGSFNPFNQPQSVYSVPPSFAMSNTRPGNRNRKRRAPNNANNSSAILKVDRMQMLEQQVTNLIKERDDAAKAATDKRIADEKHKFELEKANLADERAKLQADRAILEADRAKLDEERVDFDRKKKDFEDGQAKLQPAKSLPWYKRSLF